MEGTHLKLLKAKVTNFGSYRELEFNFQDQGLALIYGATGSGKSTLQDIPTWILFGITAKDGTVDEVKSWTASGEPTTGTIEVQLSTSVITIVRSRGKPSQNDLYWLESDSDQLHRGKDITDTQKRLNERLGVNERFYTIGAYYNEFSPTSGFFNAKASDRRELFESLANLDLPVILGEKIADAKKETRKNFIEVLEKYNKTSGKLEQLRTSERDSKRDAEKWSETQKRTVEELQAKSQNFDQEKESKIALLVQKSDSFISSKSSQIDILSKKLNELEHLCSTTTAECSECGQPKEEHVLSTIELERSKVKLENLQHSENPYTKQIEIQRSVENHYDSRIQNEKTKVNPFVSQFERIFKDINILSIQEKDLKDQLDTLNHRQNSLVQLQKMNDSLRGELLRKTIKGIESEVNRYLETYFDSELRISFEPENGDKLITTIWKSGHECSYSQLSKGQRGLLKLCFSVSVMKSASDRAGVHFDTIMFDEALDGLDSNLKLNSFNLFNELSKAHSTVLVIDHSEGLQSLFDKAFHVTIQGDISNIEER